MFHGYGFHRMGRILSEDSEDKKNVRFQAARLFGYLKPYKYQIVFVLFISICATLLNLVPPRIIGIIIDRVIVKENLFELSIMCIILFFDLCFC